MVMDMNQSFREETNGQLSFLELGESITESQDPSIISFARTKIKTFQSKFKTMFEYEAKMLDSFSLLKLNHALKNEMDVFLATFFEMYHTLTIEEQSFIQENYSSEYHKLCKLFLEYLARYVYSDGIGTRIEDSFVMQIENFIAMDQVSFRDWYYKEIIKNVVNRNKLRVNHYCIFSGKNLLKRFNTVASLEEKSLVVQDLKHDVQELIANPAFNDLFLKYDLDFVEKESTGILSMLLLYYLEQCVYSSNSLTELPKKAIEAFEMYIVYHLTSTFLLSEEQKNTLEKVKKNVSEVLASYIQKEVP